jgi:hypothetical protein
MTAAKEGATLASAAEVALARVILTKTVVRSHVLVPVARQHVHRPAVQNATATAIAQVIIVISALAHANLPSRMVKHVPMAWNVTQVTVLTVFAVTLLVAELARDATAMMARQERATT